jgi:hypothetical protein
MGVFVARSCRIVFALSLAAVASAGVAAGVPERSAGLQTLNVPEKHRELGEVYYVIPGAGTQLTWETDARLLRSVATCNRVVGYLVAPFELEHGVPPLLAGALRVPVASLSTGYGQLDAALHGADRLDREQYPEILVSFVSAGPASDVVKADHREECGFRLAGDLTVKDKTVRFEAPAELALLPFAQATQQFSPSDLLVLRMGFEVELADVGITTVSPLGPGFSGTTVHVELCLMGTTVHPDRNFDPRVKPELYVKHLAFMTRLRDFDDPTGAYGRGDAFLKEIWDDGRMLNDLAAEILTDEHVKRRDLQFVERAASRANELSGYEDPIHLSTLARLRYEQGDLDGALEWSRKAADNLAGQPFFIGPAIRAELEAYEAEIRGRQESRQPPAEE